MKDLKTKIKNMEPEVSVSPGYLPEVAPKTIAKRDSVDLTKILFEHPYDCSDGIVRPLLCDVSNFLKQNGVSSANLKAGLMTYLTLISVKLGYPLSIILRSEEPATAAHLLNVCKQIAPKESYREVQQLNYEDLYMDKKYFEKKVIICQDPSGLKKAMPDFLMLLTQGYATRQENYKSKLGNGINEHKIKCPIGFIGIEPVDRETFLNHPSIIRVPVDNTDCFKNMTLYSVNNDRAQNGNTDMRTEICRIATIFERLAYKAVVIPYYQQLFSHVLKQKPGNFLDKLKVIHKLISIFSIINNPPPVTVFEMYAKYINVDLKDINKTSETKIPITATKVEYYLTKLLLDDVIPVKINSLTANQIRVFEAVKAINFGKLTSAFINQNNVRQKLWTLFNSSKFWAKKEEIFKQVNKTSTELVSLPVVDKELLSIKKMELVESQKLEKSNKYGYYIVVLEANGSINLPNPLQISVPILCNQRVKVKNPLTGETDIIEDLKVLDVTNLKNI